MSIGILLVDDHQIFLEGLTELIQKTSEMAVVASAHCASEALQAIRKCRPDVVILDIELPDVNGVKLTQRLSTEFPDVKIVCLSMHADAQLIESMFKAGAAAYLLKDCELPELVSAVEKVMAGDTYMSTSALKVLTSSFREEESPRDESAELTEREQQVLAMLANGLSTKQMAGELDLSIKTIGTYREHIMDKLNIRTIAGLTKYAIRKGITSVD